MRRFIVIAIERDEGCLEFRDLGEYPDSVLEPLAQTAQGMGFDLMFEFDEKPDMAVLLARTNSGEGISSMDSMVRLWVLKDLS